MADKPWSVWAADSFMERHEMLNDKWSYDYGVVFKGVEEVFYRTGEKKYADYIAKTMDWFVREDGVINLYRQGEYNIDHINNGKAVLFMFNNAENNERYKKAADRLREQLREHPRTSEGAFWHKQIYPYQIWLDGVYMGSPFYAQYIRDVEKGTDYSDVINQFRISFKYLYDEKTGLMHHAWDESRQSFWCNKHTGLSENFWGRSVGWYAMACIDVLDYLPQDHADRQMIIDILEKVIDGMLKYKDPELHVWYQVIDMPNRKGNYIEASASCMMVHAMAKGMVRGVLSKEKYLDAAKKCYQGILDEFITITNSGLVNLNKVVAVSGLGPQNNKSRDGSFAYYISEPIVTNDMKGYGAFISASVFMEML
jgi:unsaturated rhamnogalacturonyl hydrolase